MIQIHKLKESDKGRAVIYTSRAGCERGIITSWNSTYIFVKFLGPQGNACLPETLEFEHSIN